MSEANGYHPTIEDVARAVREGYAEGLCIVPATEDGQKKPQSEPVDGRYTWKHFQEARPTPEKMRRWYPGRHGLGVVCGPVSGGVEGEGGEVLGGVESLEFDDREVYRRFKAAADRAGLGEPVERIEEGFCEESPGGGIHWLYRCAEIAGNTKLAERPAPTPEDPHHVDPLIETRGKGGFIICAPSFGPVHPSGRPYRRLRGSFAAIAEIAPEERADLFDLARSFDERPRPEAGDSGASDRSKRSDGWEVRPGDAYNLRTNWKEFLEPRGWAEAYTVDGTTYWQRPGKVRGVGATTNYGGSDCLFVFSTSTPFAAQQSYTRFGAYAHLEHRGDFREATRALFAQGYGKAAEKDGAGQDEGKEGFGGFGGSPPEPRPIRVELRPVPRLAPAMIPAPLRAWLVDIAARMGCPLEYPAIGALVALAALLGRKVGIRPKRKDVWLVVANLWGAVVGRPGLLKSPALEEATRPLKRLLAKAKEAYERAVAGRNAKVMVGKARAEAAKDGLKKAAREGKSVEELGRLAAEAAACEEVEEPIRKRHLVNDTSVEKLGELLRDNPNGLMLKRDELIGWLRSLDKQGNEGACAFWLESWNGVGGYTYDRIGRGTVDIPALCMSALGGIQPGPLTRYIKGASRGAGEEDDGLLQRFQLLVYPDHPADWEIVDRWPDAKAKDRAFAVFEALDTLDPAAIGATAEEGEEIPFLRFDDEAQEFFYGWWTDLEAKVRGGHESPAFESHLAKYRSLMPTLALLFHLIDLVDGTPPGPVSLSAAEMAAAWCDFLEAHARRVYELGADGDPEPARRLAERIRRGALASPFKVRDVTHKGWSYLDRPEDVERAVALLEEHDWVRGEEVPPGPSGGRPTTVYHINPRLLEGVR